MKKILDYEKILELFYKNAKAIDFVIQE